MIADDSRASYFSPDSKFLATVHNDLGMLFAHKGPGKGGRIFTKYRKATIRIWNANSCQEIRSIALPKASVEDVAFSPQNEKIAALVDSQNEPESGRAVHVWSMSGKKEKVISLADVPDHRTFIGLFFDNAGHLFAVLDDRKTARIRIWDVRQRKEKDAAALPFRSFLDEREKITVSQRRRAILRTAKLLSHRPDLFPRVASPIFGFADVSADRKLAMICFENIPGGRYDPPVDRWKMLSLESGIVQEFKPDHLDEAYDLSPDGGLAAFSGTFDPPEKTFLDYIREVLRLSTPKKKNHQAIALYDTRNGQKTAEIRNGTAARFSPDGKTLAVFTRNEIQLWDIPIRRPWPKIILVACVAALSMLAVIELLKRARNLLKRRKKAA